MPSASSKAAMSGARARQSSGLVAEGLSTATHRNCFLAVAAGEIVMLQGASGVGKTLLLRAIADLDPHDGELWLDGRACSAMSGPEWRRRVRFVPAEAAWWADRVRAHFTAPDEAARVAETLGLPPDCMDWEVARLSTGERQRLGFLRAIEDRPQVLLLDEPTGALDMTARRAVEAMIERLRREDAAIVLVIHDEPWAERLGGRRYVVERDRVRETA